MYILHPGLARIEENDLPTFVMALLYMFVYSLHAIAYILVDINSLLFRNTLQRMRCTDEQHVLEDMHYEV